MDTDRFGNPITLLDSPTDDDITPDPNEGFSGTGLMVGEDGTLLLTILDGGTETLQAFHLTATEAYNLAAMITATLA